MPVLPAQVLAGSVCVGYPNQLRAIPGLTRFTADPTPLLEVGCLLIFHANDGSHGDLLFLSHPQSRVATGWARRGWLALW